MKLKTVLKNSLFYTIANVLQGVMSFFLLPIYTNYLAPADYAILALVTSFVGIVSTVITLQIHTGISFFVIKFMDDAERAKAYFTNIFILLASILLVCCFLINTFGEGLIRILFSRNSAISYKPFFQIATWTLLPNLLTSSYLLLFQTIERGGKFFIVIAIQIFINVCLSLFFLIFFKLNVAGVLLAQFFSAIAGLFFATYFLRDWFRFVISSDRIQDVKNSIKYSLPIIPHMLSIYIFMYSDRIILQRYVPLAEVGIYSIADNFAYLLLLIVNATTAAFSPFFLKIAHRDKFQAQEETKKFIEFWWVGIMAIFMCYLMLSSYLVKLMTRPSFYPSIPYIPILAGAYIFRGLYCFATNGIFYAEKTKFIPVITIIAAMINIALNIIFVPTFGVLAAAWSTVVSYFATFLLAFYFSKKYFPIKYPWRSMFIITLLVFLGYFMAGPINSMTHLHISIKLALNIAVIVLLIIISILIVKTDYQWKAIGLIRKLQFFSK